MKEGRQVRGAKTTATIVEHEIGQGKHGDIRENGCGRSKRIQHNALVCVAAQFRNKSKMRDLTTGPSNLEKDDEE